MHAVVLARRGVGDLAFEVELLLAAELDLAGITVGGPVDVRARRATRQVHRRQHIAAGRVGGLGREHRRQVFVVDLGQAGGAARGIVR
ncbi:hypothetical protein D3C71_1883140 [compost metagenome]